jgi:hypothetical protein
MPPLGNFARRIGLNLLASARLRRVSRRRHLAAALLGRRALAVKAAAVRARLRARAHLGRARLLRAARLNAAKRARR